MHSHSSRKPFARAIVRGTLLAALLASSCVTRADEETDDMPLYDGTWTLRLPDRHAARLVVADWAGTWQPTGPQARDTAAPCRGKKVPITVQHSTRSAFEFTAWGSAVSPACPDVSYSFQPVDAGTLMGQTGTGGKVTMTRTTKKK
jgi:hypothetical protein